MTLVLHSGVTVEVIDRRRNDPDSAKPFIVTFLDGFGYEVACADGETEFHAIAAALAQATPHPYSPVRKLNLTGATL